jgi:uncharacterized coiled-coil DUF342 family protein
MSDESSEKVVEPDPVAATKQAPIEPPSPEKLSSTLNKDSKLVRELKDKLSSLGNNGESAVRELREIGAKLRSMSARVNELKAGRDAETAAVRELKVKRQEANEAMKSNSSELKKASEARDAARVGISASKIPPRVSASRLASEIEAIETKFETDVMPFEKEKQLMKTIKDKKKLLKSVKAISESSSAFRETYSKFAETRKQSNQFHREIQQHAARSQEMHEAMIKLIPQLKELRERRKAILEQFGKLKEDYTMTGSTLHETLNELTEVKGKLNAISAEKQRKTIEANEQKLTDMLKSGKKLTARDLLLLQEK